MDLLMENKSEGSYQVEVDDDDDDSIVSESKSELTHDIPMELESNILLRLPIKPVVRCRCVCKRWRDEIINHPHFIKSHAIISRHTHKGNSGNNWSLIIKFNCPTRTRIRTPTRTHDHFPGEQLDNLNPRTILLSADFHSSSGLIKVSRHNDFPAEHLDNLSLVACSNGLLLFMDLECGPPNIHKVNFTIYNPATSNLLATPISQIAPECSLHVRAGFGYDATSDDYKILCFYVRGGCGSYVYSLKTNSWKIIQDTPDYRHCFSRIVFSNNSLHWIASKPEHGFRQRYMLCFDLEIEEYRVVALPQRGKRGITWGLVDLRGCLHLVRYDAEGSRQMKIWIWVMKQYGSTRSWEWAKLIDFHMPNNNNKSSSSLSSFLGGGASVLFSNHTTPPMPCAYSEDGHELLLSPGYYVPTFTSCHLPSGELRMVEIGSLPRDDLNKFATPLSSSSSYQVMPWFGSLVQLM